MKRDKEWVFDQERSDAARSWSIDKVWKLAEMVDQGLPDARIARTLGKSINAIRLAKHRFGVKPQTKSTYTAKRLARVLNLHPYTIDVFIKQGWISARRGQPRGGTRQWVISRESIIAFFHEWKLWIFWDPEFITDPILKNEACDARTFKVYSLKDIARIYGVSHSSAMKWARAGLFNAEFVRGEYAVKESDLEGFNPPSEYPDYSGPRYWDLGDEIILLGLVAEGASWRQVSNVLGRTPSAVRVKGYSLRDDRGKPWKAR